MRKLNQAIDRFCYRHPRFGIPNLMTLIVAGNVLVWILSMMDRTGTLASAFYFSPAQILRGQIWRLVTFPFVPEQSGLWLLISLYFYYFIGSNLERQWGTGRFTIYYLLGMVFTIVFGFVVYFATGISFLLSAYYLNMSLFFAFAALFPETRVLLFFFLPIKIKWLALLDAAYFLIAVVTNPFPINLLPVVAVLNFLVFCGGDLLAMLRPQAARRSRTTVNFKKEAARIRREQADKPYTRKCEVCGRTDADYPNLEFRYCSRCQGYHCFCEDHINNHVHFRE